MRSIRRLGLPLLLICLAAGHSTQAIAANCIMFDQAAMLNLNLGTLRTFAQADDPTFTDIEVSPDNRYVAYMRIDIYSDQAVADIGTLFVAPIDDPINAAIPVHADLPVPLSVAQTWETDRMEFQWSSDSHWLLYRWADFVQQPKTGDYIPVKQHIALATPNGEMQRILDLPIAGYVQLDSVPGALPFVTGWSADSAYVALRIKGRLAFLHIPDLSLSYPSWSNFLSIGNLCLVIAEENLYCSFWSPTGHLIAFGVLDSKNRPLLVLANPDDPKPMGVFSVDAQNYSLPYWSPGNKYVALTEILLDLKRRAGQIEIFGVDGSRVWVSSNAYRYVGGDGPDVVNVDWCGDRDLLYTENADLSKDTEHVEDYSLDTRRSTFIHEPGDPFPALGALPTYLVNCDYALQQWTQDNTDYAGVINTQTGEKTALVAHDVDDIEAIGSKIALAWWHGGIAWMNADGTHRQTLALDADITPQTASPDGRWLLSSAIQGGTTDLYLVNLTTGAYRVVVQNADNADKGFAAFSPGNTALVLAVETNQAVRVLTLADGTIRALDLGKPDKIDHIDWSPDGSMFTVLSESSGLNAFDAFKPDGTLIRHYGAVPNFSTLTWLSCQP